MKENLKVVCVNVCINNFYELYIQIDVFDNFYLSTLFDCKALYSIVLLFLVSIRLNILDTFNKALTTDC